MATHSQWYAFIPYTPYDGNYEKRPNQGLMIDLRNGTAHEIKGDDDFANWAKNNQNTLHTRFNASDRQGGKEAHWPKAGDILDTLIRGKSATYPGYQNLLKDQSIPVRETFNYTRARGEHYQLKFGNLDNNIASKYTEQNATNAVWADQTEVFGSSQQNWKAAKDFWGNTFGYVPVVGNAGNIVFGVHDGIYGKTAEDRIGGSSGAVISALQLAHELATTGVAGAEEPHSAVISPDLRGVSWRYNSPSSDFELVRTPKVPPASEEVPSVTKESRPGTSKGTAPVNTDVPQPLPRSPSLIPMAQYAVADGEELIKNAHRDALGVYRITDNAGALRQYVRITDETGTSKVFEISGRYRTGDPFAKIIDQKTGAGLMVVTPGRDGEWARAPADGGVKWLWRRPSSPTPSDEIKAAPKISDGFEILGDPKTSGADQFDKFMKSSSTTRYEQAVNNFEENGIAKQKLTVSWAVEEDNFKIFPSEAATPNEYGATPYSDQFLKDLDRDDYTVVTKGSAGKGDTIKQLDARGSCHGETQKLRLEQLENAIPNPAIRTRISEIAHQGSIAPGSVDLKLNHLKEHVGIKGMGNHYTITYDPATNSAEVFVSTKIQLTDLENNSSDIPGTSAGIERTFKISESNELNEDGNPFAIEKKAPIHLKVSTTSDR